MHQVSLPAPVAGPLVAQEVEAAAPLHSPRRGGRPPRFPPGEWAPPPPPRPIPGFRSRPCGGRGSGPTRGPQSRPIQARPAVKLQGGVQVVAPHLHLRIHQAAHLVGHAVQGHLAVDEGAAFVVLALGGQGEGEAVPVVFQADARPVRSRPRANRASGPGPGAGRPPCRGTSPQGWPAACRPIRQGPSSAWAPTDTTTARERARNRFMDASDGPWVGMDHRSESLAA